ncbi:MAG: FAD-dependent oxidoreductase [Chloroflexi bacterium]|nr:FAD-dependent oxidoreductase [Chloroflexota bacterium]
MRRVDALVIGGGPSGLAAAIAMRRNGISNVVVIEREHEAGGVPRHCHHTGFGIRDLRRVMRGPGYAKRYVELAEKAGVQIVTDTMVTGWSGADSVQTTSPTGLETYAADAIVLATGCRERPRSARLVAGSRPAGVFTTGALQQWVYLHSHPIGTRAVVVGAEHVSFSAVMTLKHAGVDVAAVITEHPFHQSIWPYTLITTTRWRVPVLTNTALQAIHGRHRVESVEVIDAAGASRSIPCDTVVFTGDWVPDYELAASGNVRLEGANRAPEVDTSLRTSTQGVFAIGNLVHPAETADLAALTGRFVAQHVRKYLEAGHWRGQEEVRIETSDAIQWVSPQVIDTTSPSAPNRMLSLRVNRVLEGATISIIHDGRSLWRRRYRRLVPNLPIHVPGSFLSAVRSGDTIRLEVGIR